ncbi:DUF7007 domain-containing protein [Rhodococcus pyridinivorans]|uniref:DUF7007 domain-containing protein n=1 Tax=Rhodococcus pyridinivorans TaxID=103816 RepID=UPI0039B5B820
MNADNRIPTSSPWGAVQDGRVLAHGIIIVSTSGHGGVRISPARLKQMPAALRLGRRRWFEEDCEAALVGLAFADDLEFTDSRRDDLAAVVANWFPTNWEAYFGRTLEPGESYLRDKETFEAATADQFVVDSALGDWHEDVPAGLVGVTALRRSDGITTPLLPDFVLGGGHRARTASADDAQAPATATAVPSRVVLAGLREQAQHRDADAGGAHHHRPRCSGRCRAGPEANPQGPAADGHTAGPLHPTPATAGTDVGTGDI